MAEPELAFARKTMDDLYGRHALVHSEGAPVFPAADRVDVNHLIPGPQRFHLTRVNADYQPRHAAAEHTDYTDYQEVQQ